MTAGRIGEDNIRALGARFNKGASADDVAINAPAHRNGEALRIWVGSPCRFEKEASMRSVWTRDK